MDKKRILFVDDEPNVLQGLRRMLRPLRKEWDMSFVGSGEEALEAMAQQPCDVIVSDIRMPGMSGVELLEKVRDEYPDTARIALSGQADKETIFSSVGPVHQFLSKPCDAEMLKDTVGRACALHEVLRAGKLRKLVSQTTALPTLPAVYKELFQELSAPDASLSSVEKLVSKDLGLTAKVLQLVNSAFFGIRQQVSTVGLAVSLLGLDAIKALVLSLQVFEQFDPEKLNGLSLDALFDHSMAVGAVAKRIARAENAERQAADDGFMAGILHDVGKLIIAVRFPTEYKKMRLASAKSNMPLYVIEQKVLGATHAEVGAYLLGLWGLSNNIVEGVAFHHQPSRSMTKAFSPLTAVHAANALVHDADAENKTDIPSLLDTSYIDALGLSHRLEDWRGIVSDVIDTKEEQ